MLTTACASSRKCLQGQRLCLDELGRAGRQRAPLEQAHPALPPCRSTRYLRSYFITDLLACLPWDCIMVRCNSSLNYYK